MTYVMGHCVIKNSVIVFRNCNCNCNCNSNSVIKNYYTIV